MTRADADTLDRYVRGLEMLRDDIFPARMAALRDTTEARISVLQWEVAWLRDRMPKWYQSPRFLLIVDAALFALIVAAAN